MAAPDSRSGSVDLAEVQRLVQALEADLAQVRSGSKPVDALREEVEALRQALHQDEPAEAVAGQLDTVRDHLAEAIDSLEAAAIVPADYIARIGRLLGL